jgi:hypothetical protein
MAEDRLELRLRTAAAQLDKHAPAFDVGRLRTVPARRTRRTIVTLSCVVVVLAGAIAAPAAVSSIRGLFEVDVVPEIGPLETGVAPPFAGRSIPPEDLAVSSPFGVWTISSLGAPDEARVRDDITGGMVTVVYRGGGILLTQWRTTDVSTRVAVVPVDGAAEDVTVGALPALWIEGAARGTFTLVGADGEVHRESFDVGSGVLLWSRDGVALLLRGVGKAEAIELARSVER